MQLLFVHGMVRSPISALPMLWQFKKRGLQVSTFFYSVTFEKFDRIAARLARKIQKLADRGDYILVGHSLGGILIRGALAALPPETRQPVHFFSMGSPVQPPRLARYLQRNWLFRLVTGDCGQMLASEERMQIVAPSKVPTTSIIGTRGLYGKLSPFGDEMNDSIVAASESAASWVTEEVQVPVHHQWMPASNKIAQLILERIAAGPENNASGESS